MYYKVVLGFLTLIKSHCKPRSLITSNTFNCAFERNAFRVQPQFVGQGLFKVEGE